MPLEPLTTLFRRAPPWLWVGALGLIVYPLTSFALGGGTPFGPAVDMLASAVRLVLEGAAFLWAYARLDLPPRLRTTLKLTGWASMAAAVNYLVLLPPALGGPRLISDSFDTLWTLAVYAAACWALIIYPRRQAVRGERSALVIDQLITAGGLGLLGWTLVTSPSAANTATSSAFRAVQAFGVAQIALLIGVNLVVVRGLVVPSRRAFWWFVTGQAAYVPLVVLAQFERAGYVDAVWSNAVYYFGVLPTLAAALTMRSDPVATAPLVSRLGWMRDFNPLPLGVPIAVGACLLLVLVRGPVAYALPLAATLVAVSMLLAARLLLSAHHSSQLARQEADNERRRQAERLNAVGRLAGGVAHEFNNLMARVVGNAELGEATAPPDSPAREYFAKVKVAALRAAELTRQLLAFSGRQRTYQAPVDVEPIVRAVLQQATHSRPAGIATSVQIGPGPLTVHADAAQLGAALEQLLENAVEAMPGGGRLELTVAVEHLMAPLQTPLLSVPPGRYVTLSVRDTGVGIPTESLAVVCDPFYSTKPTHLAAGLGLASVHGIVASHSGGLRIESTLGAGTCVILYLPACALPTHGQAKTGDPW